jgi:hypothetical protein
VAQAISPDGNAEKQQSLVVFSSMLRLRTHEKAKCGVSEMLVRGAADPSILMRHCCKAIRFSGYESRGAFATRCFAAANGQREWVVLLN